MITDDLRLDMNSVCFLASITAGTKFPRKLNISSLVTCTDKNNSFRIKKRREHRRANLNDPMF